MATIKIKKMRGIKEGILIMSEKGEFLLSFDEMSKYPNQSIPMGAEIEIESCGDGFALVKIGKAQMKFSEEWLRERHLL